MQRIIFVTGASAALLGLVYLLNFPLEIAVGISGIIGTAAGLAALWEAKQQVRKPHFTVSDARFVFKDEVFRGYEFEATIINEGDQADVLRRVDQQLYHRDLGFIRSVMTCVERELTSATAKVLPIECCPRVAYRVEGRGSIVVSGSRLYMASGSSIGKIMSCDAHFSSLVRSQ